MSQSISLFCFNVFNETKPKRLALIRSQLITLRSLRLILSPAPWRLDAKLWRPECGVLEHSGALITICLISLLLLIKLTRQVKVYRINGCYLYLYNNNCRELVEYCSRVTVGDRQTRRHGDKPAECGVNRLPLGLRHIHLNLQIILLWFVIVQIMLSNHPVCYEHPFPVFTLGYVHMSVNYFIRSQKWWDIMT